MKYHHNVRKFAIRKLSVGVASVLIGTGLLSSHHAVQADTNQWQEHISYHYILESELLPEDKARIINNLPSNLVSNTDTYFMVYKPKTTPLPNTGSYQANGLVALGGASFIILAASLTKKKQKILTTILIVSATGSVSVSAIEGHVLSSYDKNFVLSVGEQLPQTIITIPNYQFVGYILEDNHSSSTKENNKSEQSQSQQIIDGDKSVPAIDNSINSENMNNINSYPLASQQGESTQQPLETVPEITETISTTIEQLPYQVIYEPDDNLLYGEEITIQEGHYGERTIQRQGNKVIIDNITIEPQNRIIHRGTKVITNIPSNPPIIEKNPVLAPSTEAETNESKPEDTGNTLTPTENTSNSDITNFPEEIIEEHITPELPPAVEIVPEKPTKETIETAPAVEAKPEIPIETTVTDEVPNVEAKPETPIETTVTDETPNVEAKPEIPIEEITKIIAFSEERIPDTSLPFGTETIEREGVNGTRKIIKIDGKVISDDIITLPINRIVKFGSQKQKPILTYRQVETNDLTKALTISYNLSDKESSYIGAKVFIYDGENLVKESEIANLSAVSEILDYYETPYRIITTMSYDLNDGHGVQTETLKDKLVEINLKKIEFKQISAPQLIKYEDNKALPITTLAIIPDDKEKYFIKLKSDKTRDILLPVSAIEEIAKNGATYYKVTSQLPELVQDTDISRQSSYQEGYSFLIPKTPPTTEGVYVTFSELAKAIKADPSGTFTLGAELYADELPLSDKEISYFGDFSGQLIGKSKDKAYAIYGLKAPLFNRLSGKIISLDLEDVDITTSASEAGSLANEVLATASIDDIAISGSITGSRTVGGIIGRSIGANISNVSFEGKITSTNNNTSGQAYVGGIVGYMEDGKLSKAYVDAAISTFAGTNNQRAGGIAGQVNGKNAGTTVSKVYAKGILNNRSANTGTTSGLVASIWPNANLKEATSEMMVPSGTLLYADTNHTTAKVDNKTVAAIEGITSANENKWASRITQEEAQRRIAAYGITATTKDSDDTRPDNHSMIDYTVLHQATKDREIAYLNIEKLIPFYNKEQIVKYGNLVDKTSKLFQTKLLSVTPMSDNTVLANISNTTDSLNKILLHFEDGTVDYMTVSYKENFKNSAIREYDISNSNLIYTPDTFITDYSNIIASVATELKSVPFKSKKMVQALGIVLNDKEISDLVKSGMTEEQAKEKLYSSKMDQLFLEEAFNQVKVNIETLLGNTLATSQIITNHDVAINQAISNSIKANKEELLIGLAYVQRWYNINFDNLNFQGLATFHQDFFGKSIQSLDWLISLAKAGYNTINPANNVLTYTTNIAPNTGILNQMDYLSHLRQLFVPNKTDNQWFKDNTKAYIIEQTSDENPTIDVTYWQRVKDSVGNPSNELNAILPLLSADEGIFIITNIASITYGMYDRYFDMSLKESAPAEYAKKVQELKEKLNYTAKRFAENIDVWYRIVDDSVKPNLIKVVPIWDGYKRFDGKWYPMYGVDANTGLSPNKAMTDFFSTLGDRASVGNNGSGAFANGWLVKYVHYAAATEVGLSTFSHEMTHNLDGRAYLGGYGRRQGMGAESFATGMFEAPSVNSDVLAYNLIYDNSAKKDATNRLQVTSPERFKNAEDLHEYAKGSMDVIYTLDYAETVAVLSQSKDIQKKWYIKLENTVNDKGEVASRYRQPTDEEWENMTLTSVDDLITNNLMTRRTYGETKDLGRNGYNTVHMFAPIFAGLANTGNTTPTSSLIFKLRAYEMMAAKGYQDGFIPYASNKLNTEAKAAGLSTQTEDFVLGKIFNNQYKTWADFKKDMFKQRIDNKDRLKEITFTYNDKNHTINNFSKLQELMNDAVKSDIQNGTIATAKTSKVHSLKAAIYNAYLRTTEDFESSIYNAN